MNDVCSMTGFGSAEGSSEAFTFTCDVRSVNHRFCDVRVKLPREFVRLEPMIQQRVRKRIGRGRVEVAVRSDAGAASDRRVVADTALALQYRDALDDLAEVLDLQPPKLPVTAYAGYEGVLRLETADLDESAETALLTAVDDALVGHRQMRRDEGAALAADLHERLLTVARLVDEVEQQGADQLPRLQQRLSERLRVLLADVPLDTERVLTEAAVVAERADVTEEQVRLRQHVAAFTAALDGGGRIGRKLDFLTQEMLREANTIGSKAWEAPISLRVIEIKSEIERIREQVQNVE
jgi:uncharacterized protein (TIGR00255 family)